MVLHLVVQALPSGGRTLRPASFVVVKLLTERLHKGAKDKLQALLVLAERAEDKAFEAEVCDLLAGVTRERLGRELVGTVGPRADLFALYEKVEGIGTEVYRSPA